MAIGLVGRKRGMTRVFTDAGETVPVTVIEVLPNRVTQVKSADKDGYRAVQVTYGKRRPQLYGKALNGHYAKAKVEPGRSLVGNAGVTIYRVGTIKRIPGVRTYVAVDGGMSDNLRPMLYGARYEAEIADRFGGGTLSTIAGMHCESGDVLVQGRERARGGAPRDLRGPDSP